MSTKQLTAIQKAALKMHTHIIVYKRGSEEETVTIMAQAGMTTKAIAEALGLPES